VESNEMFAADVRRQCHEIMGAALAGNNERAGELAAALCTQATAVLEQSRMQQEAAAGDYNLADLVAVVNPATASNSETFFDRD